MPAITITDLNRAKQDVDHIAAVATSSAATATDRLGRVKPTLNAALAQIGYAVPVAYDAGITLRVGTQTVEHDGVVYAPLVAELPFTTGGAFERAKFRVVHGLTTDDAGKLKILGTATGEEETNLSAYLNLTVKGLRRSFGCSGDPGEIATARIATAVASGKVLEAEEGTYTVDSPITLPDRCKLYGPGTHNGAIILGTHGGNIFEFASTAYLHIEGMAFTGSACSAFRQTAWSNSYMERPIFRRNHFYGQLAECISGNLIYALVEENTFGYYGTVGGAHRHIVSLGGSSNITNLNSIKSNRFYNAKGTESCKFDSGVGLHFSGNNWEKNTCRPLSLNGMQNTRFTDANWFESNSGTDCEIESNVGLHVSNTGPLTLDGTIFVSHPDVVWLVKVTHSSCALRVRNSSGVAKGKFLTNQLSTLHEDSDNLVTGLQDISSWKPIDASGAGLVLAGSSGKFSRIGNRMFVTFSFAYPPSSSRAPARIGGLPVASTHIMPLSSGGDNSASSVVWLSDVGTTVTPYSAGTLTARTNAQLSGKQVYVSGELFV